MADAFLERQTTVDNETAFPVNDFADAVVTLQPRTKRSQFRKMIRAQGRVVARCKGPGYRAGVGGIDILADHDDLRGSVPYVLRPQCGRDLLDEGVDGQPSEVMPIVWHADHQPAHC